MIPLFWNDEQGIPALKNSPQPQNEATAEGCLLCNEIRLKFYVQCRTSVCQKHESCSAPR